MPAGYISHINKKGHFGFIDSPEEEIEHIYFHFNNCIKLYKNAYEGDKVSFELDVNDEKGPEAKSVSFIQNASLDGLKADFSHNNILKGFLKKIGENYYVKDKETYLYIRLIVAKHEINLNEVYEDKLNSIISYKIVSFTQDNEIKAINFNREISAEFDSLFEGLDTEAIVTLVVKWGFEIKTRGNILGFLPNSLALKRRATLEAGEIINVTCIKVSDALQSPVFDLTENIVSDNEFAVEQERFVSTLKPGDQFLGTIKSAQGFGAFVTFGLSEGLLHINNILGEENTLPKSSKKEFAKIIEKIFVKGQEIDIEVENVHENRISLALNMFSENNRDLHQKICFEYKTLKQ